MPTSWLISFSSLSIFSSLHASRIQRQFVRFNGCSSISGFDLHRYSVPRCFLHSVVAEPFSQNCFDVTVQRYRIVSPWAQTTDRRPVENVRQRLRWNAVARFRGVCRRFGIRIEFRQRIGLQRYDLRDQSNTWALWE